MNILKTILKIAVILVVLVVVIGLFLPSRVHVERDIWIDAPPANVFTLLNGYGRFNDWSPWAELDPDAEYRLEGPETGVGATMHWTGDDSVGSGSQAIVASEPYNYIETALDFGPMGTAVASYTLQRETGGTRVTWAMDTDFGWDLMGRYMGLFFDRWVGADYEKGLANLKALAESLPGADLADADIAVVELEPRPIAYVRGETSHEAGPIAAALTEAYGRVNAYLAEHGLEPDGAPIAVAHEWEDNRYVFDAALPYREAEVTGTEDAAAEAPPEEDSTEGEPAPADDDDEDRPYTLAPRVELGELPGGRAVRAVHAGPYDALAGTWNRVEAYIALRGLETAGSPWEVYLGDPGSTPEEELVTHIFWPVR